MNQSNQSNQSTRVVSSMTVLAPRQASPGFIEGTVFHGGRVVLDPLLAITDFHMTQPTFAPHPHAGFSAVTYMFRDSPGSFRNRDSLGDESMINPGDLHWTQAAHGMMHEEIPTEAGIDCHGMQLFVNLRAEHKHAVPQAFHLLAADIRSVEPSPGVLVRVVTGAAFGIASPLDGLLTPITLLDIDIAPNTATYIPVAAKDRAVTLINNGSVIVGGIELQRLAVASLDGPSEQIEITAGTTGASLLILSGTPIEEPVLFGGPFCMNTQADIDDARHRYTRGDMGHLTPSF
jgi:redox-sensitive bicupin YhaK (pirin superfamily)